jgi:large subunit ribosomal protein L25
MTENIRIKATSRETVGKANRRLDDSQLAAVVYGAAVESRAVSVDRHDFAQVLTHEANISSRLIDLMLDGAAKPLPVIVKAIQHDAVKGTLFHVDFWAVNMRQPVTTTVPVHFEGEAAGVKTGGVFMHNVNHITVEALPDDLPESVTFDVTALEVGDSVHVRDLVAPKGVTILDHEDEIVASIVPPAKEEEVVAEEVTEPEVIGETAEEEE